MEQRNDRPARGILITTSHGCEPAAAGLLGDRLLPLVDRPWTLRAAETLVALGCRQIDVVLGENAPAVRALLGDGERFGCAIRYGTIPEGAGPLEAAWVLPGDSHERVWLATDRQLPAYRDLAELAPAAGTDSGIALLTRGVRGELEWSGWGCFTLQFVKSAAVRRATWQTLNGWALRAPFVQRRFSDRGWQATSPQALLASQARFLKDPDAPLGIGLGARAPGVFVSPRARVHADAIIAAPAYIGADCIIGAGAVIGPNAVIREESIVGEGSTVADSLVLPGTYVGPDLSLRHAIVDRDAYIDAELETALDLRDPDLIGPARRVARRAPRVPLWHRAVAAVLCAAALPWLAFRLLRSRPPRALQESKEAIFRAAPDAWRAHFSAIVVPRIGAVAAGRLALTGLELRGTEELARLDSRWRELYAAHRMGLVSASLLLEEDGRNDLARRMADAYAAAHPGAAQDLQLLARYAGRVLRDLRAGPMRGLAPAAGRPRGDAASADTGGV